MSGEPKPFITVKVKNQDQRVVFFRIKRNVELRVLMNKYCDELSVPHNTLRFFLDDRRLQPHQTPEQAELEDDDEIDAFAEQLGGWFQCY